MQKLKLSESLEITRIVLGLWRLLSWKMEVRELGNYVRKCLDAGVDTFDHADIYGNYEAEEKFGAVFSQNKSLRQECKLITKCGIVLQASENNDKINYYNTSKAHIIQSVNNSLRNLKTDYIDLLLIHRPDPIMDPEEVAEAFSMLEKEGKVLNFGVSNFSAGQFNLLNSYTDQKLLTNQIEFSPWQLKHLENGDLDHMMTERIHPLAWSPLAGGKLLTASDEKARRIRVVLKRIAEKKSIQHPEEIIYAWILKHPAKIAPVVGTGKFERLERAISALDVELSREEWFEILVASQGHPVP